MLSSPIGDDFISVLPCFSLLPHQGFFFSNIKISLAHFSSFLFPMIHYYYCRFSHIVKQDRKHCNTPGHRHGSLRTLISPRHLDCTPFHAF